MYDVLIIGAGVTGSAVARELSRYKLKIAVMERCSDICEGTSKANSGIVHAGHDAKPGSLKAKLNVEGNKMMEALSKELDFPYRKNGSLVLCFDKAQTGELKKLYEQGIKNGVKNLSLMSADETRKLEPEISEKVVAALYAPEGGIVCPFGLTIALAENAAVNGVEFHLGAQVSAVEKISKKDTEGYRVYVKETDNRFSSIYEDRIGITCMEKTYEAKVVINCAGVYADVFHNMVSNEKIHIIPRKGEYCLMDKNVGKLVDKTIFQLPTALGKGVLVTPTVHGNLLVGPSAVDVDDYEETATTSEGLADIMSRAALSVSKLPNRQTITSFAGLRAHEEKGDFVIGEVSGAEGYVDVAGIESPGLTCAPAIGRYVTSIVINILNRRNAVEEKTDFIANRKGIPNVMALSAEERQRLIEKNPAYGNIICRCEMVTEGEIRDAIRRPLGASTLDGIKRRTRAGMGRCQAGFCSPKTVSILAEELQVPEEFITKCGGKSGFLYGNTRRCR
ncbi:MAG: NAD(P)/FAD-dependent oxidoreductase [Eubacteriales bacterium]|nr:NAD(P)/FAD-dependent oxidoreductase [Eubacteriales bacterium]